MLTSNHIDARKVWAQAHLNDNWDRTMKQPLIYFVIKLQDGIKMVKNQLEDYQNHDKK